MSIRQGWVGIVAVMFLAGSVAVWAGAAEDLAAAKTSIGQATAKADQAVTDATAALVAVKATGDKSKIDEAQKALNTAEATQKRVAQLVKDENALIAKIEAALAAKQDAGKLLKRLNNLKAVLDKYVATGELPPLGLTALTTRTTTSTTTTTTTIHEEQILPIPPVHRTPTPVGSV